MRRAGAVVGALTCAAIALQCGRGCGANNGIVTPMDAGAVSTDSYIPWDGSEPACPAPPRPAAAPDGWELYGDYKPCCGFYVPGPSAQMPSPITWESCGANVVPSGITCERMKFDWNSPIGSPAITIATAGTKNGSTVFLQFDRFVGNFIYDLIADADGPIAHAFVETNSDVCTLGSNNLNGSAYAYNVRENKSFFGGGLLTGTLTTARPTALSHFSDGLDHSSFVGLPNIVDFASDSNLYIYDEKLTSRQTIWSSARDNGLANNFPFFYGDTLFWNANSLDVGKVHVWTVAAGAKDFISFPDLTRTAGSLGTDGVDMVWLEGSSRLADGGYPPASIMTAPYTTDPSQITKRRLRSEQGNGVGLLNFTVGCGYAARDLYGQIRLVRISDGRSWLLTPNATNSKLWRWMTPLVLTCTEMFAYVTANGQPNIARVRLGSLGPGDPPD